MNYIATKLKFLDGVKLELTFIDGKVIQYDMSKMFTKYPQFKKLEDREFFESGKLWPLGEVIYWDEDVDYDTAAIYLDGLVVGEIETSLNQKLAVLLSKTREDKGITQTQLSKLSRIDQGDISRIECGKGNPTLKKIENLFNALDTKIEINIK